jgi:glycosyltransferase involved in cell wall biosynthesis
MDNEIKKLTIGILTYNNPLSLRAELECVLSQLAQDPELESKVQVLVSDNSENNETKELIASRFANAQNLTYIKNEKNIGYDRNVDQVLSKAKGGFCWVLSDNDPIIDGGIARVVAIIEEHPEIVRLIIGGVKTEEPFAVFLNTESLLRKYDYLIVGGLISRNVFNTKLLPKNRSEYYDNLWFHISVALEMGAKSPIALVEDLLSPKTDNECRWAKDGLTFTTYTNLHGIVMNLKQFGYSETFLQAYHKTFLKDLPHQLVTAKLFGLTLNKKSIKRLYEHTKHDKGVFFVCFVLLVIPTFIFRIARYLWKKL